MDQILNYLLGHGGGTVSAVLAAASVIGALLYREDLIPGTAHRRDLAREVALTAEWKAIAIKATDTAAVTAVQVRTLTETVETLTGAVQAYRSRGKV